MVDVFVLGPDPERRSLIVLGNRAQPRFHFGDTPGDRAVPLAISDAPSAAPFYASRSGGVTLTSHHSDDICRYAEMDKDRYFLICSLLGLTQWRALELNPLLEWEDFMVREDPGGCLFSTRAALHEYALSFEDPYVCEPCLEFFRCLGAEPETLALQQVLEDVAHGRG